VALQESRTYADINAVIGGYLRDLAFAQSSQPKMFGYKRAAAVILALDAPLTDLAGPDGALAAALRDWARLNTNHPGDSGNRQLTDR
jgi:hypothetical protein